MTQTIIATSPLELIELLGRMIREAVNYDGRDRDLENLRKVYALNRAGDPRWVKFLALWIEETPSERCASAATSILDHHYDLSKQSREQALENYREHQATKTITQDGMYQNPATGAIFKVQWNRGEGDGKRLYAKQLLVTMVHDSGQTKTLREIPLEASAEEKDVWEVVGSEFVYAPGVMKEIRPEWRMTLEQAKAFGALYGTCIRCGRTLTLEESIERAMGRKCASKF